MVMGDDVLTQIDRNVNINKPACLGALETLSDKDYVQNSVIKTLKERAFLEENLLKLGLEVYKSEANFLLVKTDILDLALILREKGILIEDLSRFWLNGYYRISVGNREENKSLIEAIQAYTTIQ
jgi:histidinol-phosphate aminotransferase